MAPADTPLSSAACWRPISLSIAIPISSEVLAKASICLSWDFTIAVVTAAKAATAATPYLLAAPRALSRPAPTFFMLLDILDEDFSAADSPLASSFLSPDRSASNFITSSSNVSAIGIQHYFSAVDFNCFV